MNRDDYFNADSDAVVFGYTGILLFDFSISRSTAVVLFVLSVCNLFSSFLGLITIK